MPELILLTGGRGAGKTTLCRLLAEKVRRGGGTAGGVISPPVFKDGIKIEIEVEDLASGRRLTMARLPLADTPAGQLRTEGWVFDPAGMALGAQALEESQDCSLLVVDELGPLEILRGEGWQAGIRAVDRREYRLALVVIRPELMPAAQMRWPAARVVELGDASQTEGLAEELSRIVLGDCS